MRTLSDWIVIHAPLEAVFQYATDPHRMAEWLPSLIETRNVVGADEGQQYEWTYKMLGILFRGQTVVVEHQPNALCVFQSIGAVNSTWSIRVEPEAEGTRFTIDIEYEVPMPMLGQLAERLIVRRAPRNLGVALANVKDIMEA